MIRLVVFDLGNVLVRFRLDGLLDRLAGACARPPAEVRAMAWEPSMVEDFECGRVSPEQFFAHLQQRLGLSLPFAAFVEAWNSIFEADRAAMDVFERTRAVATTAVLTNTNILHDTYVRQTWPELGRAHHWIASHEVGMRKPDARIYELVLSRTGMRPQETVYLDDIAAFVAAARSLGIRAIHRTPELNLETALRAEGLAI